MNIYRKVQNIMKYKSFSRIFLSVSLLCGYGAVSPVSANNALPTSTPIQAEAHTALRQTRDSIRQSLLLLGEDDNFANHCIPGSTKNYASDGSTLIGRIYSLPLFNENAQAGTLYDANGKTNVVTIPLASPQAKPYSKVMRELYGAPTAVQNTPSEGGATWEEWALGKNNIRLYQEYGLSTLELTRKADITSYNPEAWIPPSIPKQYAETNPCPELEKAVVTYYGIPEEERASTRYAYNKVDFNGNGTEEIFAVITGPYTSGTGGDSAVWGRLFKGKFQIYQSFTLIRTPVIITQEATNGLPNGAKSIIVRRSGGGAPAELIQYVSHDGEYVPEPFSGLEKVKGTAILCAAPGNELGLHTLTHY